MVDRQTGKPETSVITLTNGTSKRVAQELCMFWPVAEHLDLKDAVHVGHSTGGGEVVRDLARHGESRITKAVLISGVPPLMIQTADNPEGLPKDVFDGFQAQVANNRSQFYRDIAAGPFNGYDRPGAKPSEGVVMNW